MKVVLHMILPIMALIALCTGQDPSQETGPGTAQFRDPFHQPRRPVARMKQTRTGTVSRPPGLKGQLTRTVTLTGVVTLDSRRWALLKTPDDSVYVVRAGDRLYDGFIKTILRDSIVLIHTIEGGERTLFRTLTGGDQ